MRSKNKQLLTYGQDDTRVQLIILGMATVNETNKVFFARASNVEMLYRDRGDLSEYLLQVL